MEQAAMKKSLKLEIEDLEERIAPGLTLTVGLNSPEGSHTVAGPAAATGGAVTAFTAVTGAGVVLDNVDVSFTC